MTVSIILCEGETDQALVGCYQERTAKWEFVKKYKKNPFPNDPVIWYRNANGDCIGIWQVGGNDFSEAIGTILKRENLEHLVDNIAIITDHDDIIAETSRLSDIENVLAQQAPEGKLENRLKANVWTTVPLNSQHAGVVEMQILYLLVPIDEVGALETFMMNSLSEQSTDKENVISQSKQFVRNFKSDCYLQQRREKIKAELGVSLAVFSPDRIFTTMKELIDSVPWDQFALCHTQFSLLEHLN